MQGLAQLGRVGPFKSLFLLLFYLLLLGIGSSKHAAPDTSDQLLLPANYLLLSQVLLGIVLFEEEDSIDQFRASLEIELFSLIGPSFWKVFFLLLSLKALILIIHYK